MRPRSSAIFSKSILKSGLTAKSEALEAIKNSKTRTMSNECGDMEIDEFFEEAGNYVDIPKSTSILSSCSTAYTYRDSVFSNPPEESDDKVKIYKTIIIGAKGVGKHSLVASMFSQEEPIEKNQSGFDFVSHSIHEIGETKQYKFWIQDLDYNQEKYMDLYQIYSSKKNS